MIKGNLPESELQGNMIKLPALCGKHNVFYPAKLGILAVQQHKFHVFMTQCECGNAYIVATQEDGAHFRNGGNPMSISDEYEKLPWPEKKIEDANGIFFCKEAPSHDELLSYFQGQATKRSGEK